ncbi:MAG: TonB-dependent receptor [Chloroherpetonaceae bacterium]|nr:TonB-dependent receptor [Chloroherpetonaceae bacterium]
MQKHQKNPFYTLTSLSSHSSFPHLRPALLIIILISYFFSFVSLLAQETISISGKVRDKETGEDLIGAQVFAKDIGKGVITNAYGYYSLSIPKGNILLIVRYAGYQEFKKSIEFINDQTLNIELLPLTSSAEEIVVEATKKNENVTSTEMSTVQVSIEQLKRIPVVLGETDVLRTLTLLPGITVQTEGGTGFNVRGGSTDQNLILLDEATIYNASHLFGFFSVFNSDAIKDFKLYKAGIPASFGGRLSSVLDVRQRDGNVKSISGIGGLGLISSRLLLEGPLFSEKGSFMIAGRRSYADIFLPLSSDESIRNNIAYFYDLNLKLNYELGENDRVFLSGYFGRDNFEIAEIFGNGYGNSTLTLRWNHLFGKKLFSNFSAIYNNYDYELRNLTPASAFEIQSNIISYTLKADFTFYMNDTHKIDFGAETLHYNFVPGNVVPIRGSNVRNTSLDRRYAYEGALYVTDEFTLNSQLTIDFGLRFNYFSRVGEEVERQYLNDKPLVYNPSLGTYDDGIVIGEKRFTQNQALANFSGFEPRISLRYLINDDISIKASYNRTRQNLHLISNSASPTPLDLWTPSSRYISPQIADLIALGWFQNFNDDEFEFSIETYFKYLGNVIDFVDGANLIANNFIETEVLRGLGRAYGLELFIKKNKGDLTGWVSYSLGRTERLISGTDGGVGINNGNWYPSNFDKTHNLSVVGTYQLSKRWSVSSVFVFSSGAPINYPVGRYQFSNLIVALYDGSRNQQRLPSYHRLDVSFRYDSEATEGFRSAWVFGIYNLYNRLNAASIVFRENEDTPGQTQAIQTSFFGIVPSVTWEFKF